MTEKSDIISAPYWQCKYLVYRKYVTFEECLFCRKNNGFCTRIEHCSDFELTESWDPMEGFLLILELLNETIWTDLEKLIR